MPGETALLPDRVQDWSFRGTTTPGPHSEGAFMPFSGGIPARAHPVPNPSSWQAPTRTAASRPGFQLPLRQEAKVNGLQPSAEQTGGGSGVCEVIGEPAPLVVNPVPHAGPHSEGRCLHSLRITRETVGERGPQDPWAAPSPVPALSSGVETCTPSPIPAAGVETHTPALHPHSQGRDPGLPLPAPTPFHAPGV